MKIIDKESKSYYTKRRTLMVPTYFKYEWKDILDIIKHKLFGYKGLIDRGIKKSTMKKLKVKK